MFARNIDPMPPELVSEGLNYLRSPQYSSLNDLKAREKVDPQFPDTRFGAISEYSAQSSTWMETIPGWHIDVVVWESLSIRSAEVFNVATTHFDWRRPHPDPRTA